MGSVAGPRIVRHVATLLAVVVLASLAFAVEPIGVVTELHTTGGQVEVKRADASEWQAPKPLLAIRPGDQIRASGSARAVVVLTGAPRPVTVTAANSPFVATAVSGPALGERGRAAASQVLQNVTPGAQKWMPAATSALQNQDWTRGTYQSLGVRTAPTGQPSILVPRDTRVLPGALTFEWAGPEGVKYRVRLRRPDGTVLWERADLERRPLPYPATAPALTPEARYTWELDTPEHAPQHASFEVLAAADASRLEEALAALTPASAAGYPPSTLALLRAGLLFESAAYAAARHELVTAIARDRDQPTLRLLLGHVYDRTGLRELAAIEFYEADTLMLPR